ncbi:vomeronasal type-2 receptor 26-like [Anomaloglossus baeobatrachus]
MTLGYHVSDSCTSAKKAVKSTIQILSGPEATVPNYNCMKEGNIASFIGDLLSVTTVPIAELLNLYGYIQISYGATDPMLSDNAMYPYLFRTALNDNIYFSAILTLLKRFSWNWVGIVTSEDDSGDKESQTLSSVLRSHGVCVEFTARIFSIRAVDGNIKSQIIQVINEKNKKKILKSSSTVILICGTLSFYTADSLFLPDHILKTKTFILPPSWFTNYDIVEQCFQVFNCSLGFAYDVGTHIEYNSSKELKINAYESGDMKQFLKNVRPSNYPDDKMLEDVWMTLYGCLSKNKNKNKVFELINNRKLRKCSGDEDITKFSYTLFNIGSPVVYNALLTMAYALDAMTLSLGKDFYGNKLKNPKYRNKSIQQTSSQARGGYIIEEACTPWAQELMQYLKNIQHNDGSEKRLYYDDKRELNSIYVIYNWIKISKDVIKINQVGSFTPWASPDQQLYIDTSLIYWRNNKVPRAQCSENCPHGSRKININMKPICCYGCIMCPEGEISNITDSENCIPCLPVEWSSSKRDQCLPKVEEFLDYSDSLAILLWSFSIIFWSISVLIFGIFVSHKNTPIVKANNKHLSFVLLVSLSFCFLCIFLFIGRPEERTCKLRQIVFGIIFSISVSSVLAKTIMVYMAFKTSRPGSPLRKFFGIRVSNSIVVLASSIEVIISIIWLYFSPPYLEQDTHSFQRKVIIQCNEGSQVGFFAILGYLFFLTAVSFSVAYLARTLPDRFNEAKYITFSMFVFCSVWITMVPTYLSTKGKHMVAVEVFSILASGAGLLGFIFFPKCYIIFLKPEMNKKNQLHRNVKI